MLHNVAFHQGLHCLLRQKVQFYLEIVSCDPFILQWTIPSLLHQPRRKNSLVHLSILLITISNSKVSKGAKIRNQYNQVPHLTQNTNGKVTNSQLDTTNKSQDVSSFQVGDHKAQLNRRAQRHNKYKT